MAPDMQPTSEGKPEYSAVYRKVLRLPSFHGFPAHPGLMAIAAKLLGDTVLVHPRRIGRMTFPNNVVATTPPHQDYYYIRGSVNTYSRWTPLGQLPDQSGRSGSLARLTARRIYRPQRRKPWCGGRLRRSSRSRDGSVAHNGFRAGGCDLFSLVHDP